MKLVVQIPCFNEEATLAEVLCDIPRRIPGITSVEILVVNDGSTDRTIEVARANGADHLVTHNRNRGLAAAFATGLEEALRLGADVIVNTDGDHQYRGEDIALLVEPLVNGRADMVIGDRQPATLAQFSFWKRTLQGIGGWVARWLSETDVADPVSGFRAFSRECALRLHVYARFSYTTETLIQAGLQRMTVVNVSVQTNPPTRPSRLFRNLPQFVVRSAATMIRAFAMYRPLTVLGACSTCFVVVGLLPIVRFLYLALWIGNSAGHIQSLVLGGALVIVGFLLLVVGLLGEVLACHRRLLESAVFRIRDVESHLRELRRRMGPLAPSQIAPDFPDQNEHADECPSRGEQFSDAHS